MPLSLSVTSHQKNELGVKSSAKFDESGGTIGRAPNVDLVLPDSHRHISKHHATVDFQNGEFYITDTSVNGVYVNNTLLGKNKRIKLDSGDLLSIGDYQLTVDLKDDVADNFSIDSNFNEPLALEPQFSFSEENLADTVPDAADPMELWGTQQGGAQTQQLPQENTQSQIGQPTENNFGLSKTSDELPSNILDQGNVLNEHFQPPTSTPKTQIPDDWDLKDTSELTLDRSTVKSIPTDDATQTPSALTKKATTGAKRLSQQKHGVKRAKPPQKFSSKPSKPKAGVSDHNLSAMSPSAPIEKLLQSMGLDPDSLSSAQAQEMPQVVGTLFREFIQGLMDLLSTRSEFKGALRVAHTMIQPVENNPLKFSINADEAVQNMLVKKNAGYLSAVDAVQEGFQDLVAHQMSLMAGMQAAMNALLDQFDPRFLERKFNMGATNNKLMALYSKSKYWDLYTEQFNLIKKSAKDNFQSLLGEEFASAYEDQMHKVKNEGNKSFRSGQ